MIFEHPPYFESNKDWYYFDRREFKLKLTDKAPKDAIDSYIQHYCLLEGLPKNLQNDDWDNLVKNITEKTKNDIQEFKENKKRYTFEYDEHAGQVLTKIDGKEIKMFDGKYD